MRCMTRPRCPQLGRTITPKPIAGRVLRRPAFRVHAVVTPEKAADKVAATAPQQQKPQKPLQAQLQQHGQQLVFVDESGERIPVMTADYGFRSGASRLYQEGYGTVPASGLALGVSNFKKELRALRRAVRYGEPDGAAVRVGEQGLARRALAAVGRAAAAAAYRLDCWLEEQGALGPVKPAVPKSVREGGLTGEELEVLLKVEGLQLDDAAVTARESAREARGEKPRAPLLISFTYSSLCWVLDILFVDRPIQRFWVLETVARMPYFAYISMLHLYESLGWWRAGAELRKVHFAEEWNEMHHLQIMEALGGDQRWADRFLAEHAAIFYYWVLVFFYLVSPQWSYCLMEMVEGHATDTYTQFAEQNEEVLKSLPPPLVALNYYKSGDLYLFDEFQTGTKGQSLRRPPCNNLYDVFINIRDDEIEHTKTMAACQDGSIALDFQNREAMTGYVRAEQVNVLDVTGLDVSSSGEEPLTSREGGHSDASDME